MFTRNEVFWSFDLLQLGLLPSDWEQQVKESVEQYGVCTSLDHHSITSREPKGTPPLEVCVVTGETIFHHMNWLHELYSNQLALFASQFAGRNVTVANDLPSSVNINLLRGVNARYEKHVDSNPVTGILFASTLHPIDGGELIFEGDNHDTTILPRAGIFIVFDARDITHYVAPLKTIVDRISLPMNYYFPDEQQSRPEDLNDYLYKDNV